MSRKLLSRLASPIAELVGTQGRGRAMRAAIFFAFLTLPAAGGSASAAEDAQRFLDALRERGYYDIAADYVDQLRGDANVEPALKKRLDLEAARVLVAAANGSRSLRDRDDQLAKSVQWYERFLADQPGHPAAGDARRELADVVVDRARIKLSQADSPGRSPPESQALRVEARPLLEQATAALATIEKQAIADFERFPRTVPRSDAAQYSAKEAAYGKVLEARLSSAAMAYEMALSYPPGSAERKAALQKTAEQYAQLAEKHGRFLAGLFALLGEARCRCELNENAAALDIIAELLTQPDEPENYRAIKSRALALGLEVAARPGAQPFEDSLAWFKRWDDKSKSRDKPSPEELAVHYRAGALGLARARDLDPGEKQRDALRFARQQFEYVKRYPGEFQPQAVVALQAAELRTADQRAADAPAAASPALPEPKNFAEARERATTAMQRVSQLELAAKLDQNAGKSGASAQTEAQLAAARTDALAAVRQALAMGNPERDLEAMNALRYYFAYLHWACGDFYDAAVIGNFLARRYPNSASARPGAKIALACYATLFNAAATEQRDFERKMMLETARYIADHWPGTAEAGQAWAVIVSSAVQSGDLAAARQLIEKLPPDSPQRSEASLTLGHALWANYLKGMRLPEAQRPTTAELNQMLDDAQRWLEAGIAPLRAAVEKGDPLPVALPPAVLALAQVLTQKSEPAQAVALLEQPAFGPLALADAKSPAAQRPGFALETYKLALRAYAGDQQTNKALETIDKLEAEVRNTGGADQGALTRIYVSVGRELQDQLQRMKSERSADEVAQAVKGFETILNRVVAREQGNDFNALNWVAETYAGLAESLDGDTARATGQAAVYYGKAIDANQKILARLKDPSFGAPPAAGLAVRLRLARAERRMGAYKEAVELLLEVLRERQTIVEAQLEAARTYEAWGNDKPEYYTLAISGSPTYQEIWGWGKIARRVQSNAQYRDVFFEARYELAACRMRYAQTRSGADRDAALKQAESDVTVVYRLYPEMGGPQWYAKFDDLLKTIQRLRGSAQAAGLRGLATTDK